MKTQRTTALGVCLAAMALSGCISIGGNSLSSSRLPDDRMMAIAQRFEQQGRLGSARRLYSHVAQRNPNQTAARERAVMLASIQRKLNQPKNQPAPTAVAKKKAAPVRVASAPRPVPAPVKPKQLPIPKEPVTVAKATEQPQPAKTQEQPRSNVAAGIEFTVAVGVKSADHGLKHASLEAAPAPREKPSNVQGGLSDWGRTFGDKKQSPGAEQAKDTKLPFGESLTKLGS